MVPRVRTSAIAALLILLCSCDREERESRGRPLPETVPSVTTSGLYPGATQPPAPDPRSKLYEGNAFAINEGQRLFNWFNCSGCHAHGGGGMGPPLMDSEWRYGGTMEAIVQTIDLGRPNGMPSFRDKLTEQQMWQLAAYVRSLSGNVPKDAAPSRADEMHSTDPWTQIDPQPPTGEGAAAVQGTVQ